MFLYIPQPLFFHFCLHWAFVAVRGLPLVAVHGLSSCSAKASRCSGFFRAQALRMPLSCGAQAVAPQHVESYQTRTPCIRQGLNPYPLHRQVIS